MDDFHGVTKKGTMGSGNKIQLTYISEPWHSCSIRIRMQRGSEVFAVTRYENALQVQPTEMRVWSIQDDEITIEHVVPERKSPRNNYSNDYTNKNCVSMI